MGTPRLTSLGWSKRPSLARGVKRGGSQRAEFGSGGPRCQPLSPHKGGVTIGTTPRDTGGAGRGGIPAKIVKWEENGKGGVKNTKPGPPLGPECLKNETK